MNSGAVIDGIQSRKWGLTGPLQVSYDATTGMPILECTAGSGSIGGTGTANTVAKFTATSTIGNSQITDDGSTITFGVTAVGIGQIRGPACTTSIASFRAPHGTAPSAPVNGDIWTTTAGIYVHINSGTVGPLISSGSHSHTLNSLDNPDGDKIFNMTTRQVGFLWTNPSGHAIDFHISGGYSGAVLHIHQHTGNPAPGTYLIEMLSEDSDVEHISSTGPSTAVDSYCTYVTGDTDERFVIHCGGELKWGSGGANPDANLYRSNVNELTTDDRLSVGLGFQVTGSSSFLSDEGLELHMAASLGTIQTYDWDTPGWLPIQFRSSTFDWLPSGTSRMTLDATSLSVLNRLNTPASVSGGAGFFIDEGSAPSSPTDGDVWMTSAGMFTHTSVAGTVGPFGLGIGSGTQYQLVVWATTTTLGDSIIADDGSSIVVNGNMAIAGPLTVGTLTSNIYLSADDIIATDGVFATGAADANNIDHIWHDDGNNVWHFRSDGARKATGNSGIYCDNIELAGEAPIHCPQPATTGDSATDHGVLFDSISNKRITWNDGAGNWNFYLNALYHNTNTRLEYAVGTAGAVYMNFTGDTADGSWTVRVAQQGTAGNPITWDNRIYLTASYTLFGSSGQLTISDVGLLEVPASVSGGARFNLAEGVAPSGAFDGDVWMESDGLYVHTTGGGTVGPLTDASAHPDPHLLGNGSISAPTYSFSGDTDVGMYYSSGLAFTHGGILHLTMNSSNEFARAVYVLGGYGLYLGNASTAGGIVRIYTDASSNQWTIQHQSGDLTFGYNAVADALVLTTAGVVVPQTSAVATAGFRLTHGLTPSSPVNGDIWTTTSGLYVRVNGSTIGPLVDAASSHPDPHQLASGSAGIPTYSFSSATDYGMYYAASELLWAINGAAELQLSATALYPTTNETGLDLGTSSYEFGTGYFNDLHLTASIAVVLDGPGVGGGYIRTNTSDASDTGSIDICGGGSAAANRGAILTVRGNEASLGSIGLATGAVSGSFIDIVVNTENLVRFYETYIRPNPTGTCDLGTSVYSFDSCYLDSIIVGASPTGGDKGTGTINVATDVYKNNSAYTNPDYVFEIEYTGYPSDFVRPEYNGRMSLADVREFTRQHYHLPGIKRDVTGIFERADLVLEKLEEVFLYLMDHEEKIDELFAAIKN